MAYISESDLEFALMEQLHALGYAVEREEDIGPD
jgi:type I restriction enzyme R subunit